MKMEAITPENMEISLVISTVVEVRWVTWEIEMVLNHKADVPYLKCLDTLQR
jgi:hypothetical protein